MDEEHSDEDMDDTINTSTCTRNIVTSTWTIDIQIVYMSRANAIRANNMSATNMWTIYEERSDDITQRQAQKPSQGSKKYSAVTIKRPLIFAENGQTRIYFYTKTALINVKNDLISGYLFSKTATIIVKEC